MNSINQLADILKTKKYVIAFTGAGISTESNIPDFRSPGSGLWEKIDPDLLSVRTLRSDPETFYRYYRQLQQAVVGKQPNKGHAALAELSSLGLVRAVVTQNIDGLHQKAGSKRVFEVHGNMEKCYCQTCKAEYPYEVLGREIDAGKFQPVSPCCGAILRPSVVLFGDSMPPDFIAAQQEAFRADFALVIGTSLTVYPAAEIPRMVGEFAIINRDKTAFDSDAATTINGSIGQVMTELVRILRGKRR